MTRIAALKTALAAVVSLAAAYGLISAEDTDVWTDALGSIAIVACLVFTGKQDPNQ